MKRTLVLAAALAAALPFSALAHKAWLLTSQTVIAGNAPWITVDGAVSNDLFYFCLLYTSPSPRDRTRSRMPSSA